MKQSTTWAARLLLQMLLAAPVAAVWTMGSTPTDFTCTTWNGGSFNLYAQRGKVTVLNFGATWCGPCNAELPVLQSEFFQHYDPAIFSIVHIDTDNISSSALHAHWDPLAITLPVLVGCGNLFSQYGDGYIPYNVVLDTGGVVRYTDSGFNETGLRNVVEQYLTLPNPLFDIAGINIFSDDNNDGRPDPGETVSFSLRLHNSPMGRPATNVQVTWSTGDASLTPGLTQTTMATIGAGQTVITSPAFTYTVSPAAQPHWATLEVALQAQFADGTWSQNLTVQQRIARPTLLVVDSDGAADDNETFVENALATLGVICDIWRPSESGALPTPTALSYGQIIWLGGLRNPDISTLERNTLESFLIHGGLLLISSQYASSDALNLSFLQQYFGVNVTATSGGTLNWATTTSGDPWFGGMDLVVAGSGGANNNAQPDVINVTWPTQQMAIWRQGALGPAAAYRVSNNYNAVFCGFPIEAMRLSASIPGSVTLATFLQRVLAFHAANPPHAPEAITDLRASVESGLLTLSWSYVPTALAYRVYESTDPWNFPAQAAYEVTETFIDLDLLGPRLFYQVRTVN